MQKKRQNICNIKDYPYLCTAFKKCNNMVTVVQLVRASDCGSECRGFESLQSPNKKRNFSDNFPLFLLYPPFTGTQGSVGQRISGQRKKLQNKKHTFAKRNIKEDNPI